MHQSLTDHSFKALNHNRVVTQCKWTSWLMNYANTNLPGLACSSKSDTTRSGLHVSQSPMSKNSDHHQVPSCEDKACNRRTQQKRSHLQSSTSGLSKVYTGETGCKFDTRIYEHKQHYRLIQTQNPLLLNMLSMKTIAAFDQSEILTTEDIFCPRRIKEALLIKTYPNFNQDLLSVTF